MSRTTTLTTPSMSPLLSVVVQRSLSSKRSRASRQRAPVIPSAPPIEAAQSQPHPQVREFMRQFNKDQDGAPVRLSTNDGMNVSKFESDPVKLESALLRQQLAGKTPPESLYQRAIHAYAANGQPNTAVRLMNEMVSKHASDAKTMLGAYWDVIVGFYSANDVMGLRAKYKELLDNPRLAVLVSNEVVASLLKMVYQMVDDATLVASMLNLTCERLATVRSVSASDRLEMLLPTLTNEAQLGRLQSVRLLLTRAGPLPDGHRMLSVPFNVMIVAHASANELDEALQLLEHVAQGRVGSVHAYTTTYVVVLERLLMAQRADDALRVAAWLKQAGLLSSKIRTLLRARGPSSLEYRLALEALRGGPPGAATPSPIEATETPTTHEAEPAVAIESQQQASEPLPNDEEPDSTATTEAKRRRGRPRKVPIS